MKISTNLPHVKTEELQAAENVTIKSEDCIFCPGNTFNSLHKVSYSMLHTIDWSKIYWTDHYFDKTFFESIKYILLLFYKSGMKMWIKHILQDLGCHKTLILNHNTAADSWKVLCVHVHVCECHGFKLYKNTCLLMYKVRTTVFYSQSWTLSYLWTMCLQSSL